MEYFAVAREAWRLTRTRRSLWWFGLLNAVQSVFATTVLVAVSLPLAILLPIVMARSASSVQDPEFVELSDSVLIWFSSNAAAFVAGFVLLFVIWAALAVLQVAVIGGLVAESDVAASGGSASFARGMRIGFRHWWRTAAVYLPLALPALVIMLAGSIALYATVALPLQRGSSLEPSQIARGFTLVSALSPLVLLAIPLGLLVQLAMRSAMIDDEDWKRALSSGWALFKSNPGHVFVMYLTILLVTLIATYAFEFVLMLLAALLGGVSFGVALLSVPAGVVVAVLSGLVVLAVFTAAVAVYDVYFSVAYTVFWRALTGRDLRFTPERAQQVAVETPTASVAYATPARPAPGVPPTLSSSGLPGSSDPTRTSDGGEERP